MKTSIQTAWIYETKRPLEYCYSLIRKSGFDGVDLNLDTSWNRLDVQKGIKSPCVFNLGLEEVIKKYSEELSVIKKNNLEILQAHAPFPPYLSSHPEIEEYAHLIYENCLKFCNEAGIPILVIHGANQNIDNRNESFEQNKNINLRVFGSLISLAKENNVTICLEDLFTRYNKQLIEGSCSNPYDAVSLIDALNSEAGEECFGLCFDTGHLNLLGKNQVNYAKILGNRIKAVHFHDNLGTDDNHLIPYAGNVRWEEVLDSLKAINYKGTINFETHKQLNSLLMSDTVLEIFVEAMGKIANYFADRMDS